jgi:valyl-tRNA synthetase
MDKTYDPTAIETKWYQCWENNHYFAPQNKGTPYCIMLPPPNVTGSLHMGHGFISTIMDVLTRYHRAIGDNTLWQPGTDHAGIATQLVVEKQLAAKGIKRKDLTRNEFVEKIWDWKKTSGDTISDQFRRLGASLDWPRERFTMDDSLSEAVRDVFITLYNEGLIYRGTRLVNWDPTLQTAISDLEVISVEEEGKLWHIRYPLAEGNESIIVATTRPETLLGDVAVAVHPDDPRYQHLIGKMISLPLADRQIPIIADDFVDPAFGSGCVKITPAHDFNDYAVGQRHGLTPINILTKTAHLNDAVPEKYQGLDRFAARKYILADLDTLSLLEKIDKHTAKIPRGEKSDAVIEPFLTQQWFMKMKTLAEPAIAAVEKGEIKFIPENWTKTYFQWMHNIEDWCISRQLWWGHRIPAWHGSDGKIYVGLNEADIRSQQCVPAETVLTQDEDVLDTWFSSALWPFSTLCWPKQTEDLATFYPTNVLVTGFDIIFFWVARMIMMGLKFTGQVPFKEVFMTGLICDADGKKMSKSKGNVLDPLDLIDGIDLDKLIQKRTTGMLLNDQAQKVEKNTRKQFPQGINAYGTDALRFMYCAIATNGREIRFDMNKLDSYRNFCNKLWNASRYVLMNTDSVQLDFSQAKVFSLPDQWILSRLQSLISTVHGHIKNYRFDLLATALYEFTWNEFCDWYVELSKPILLSAESSPAELLGTRYTLLTVLESLLRLLQPIIPFITEEIWQRVAPLLQMPVTSLMIQAFPQVDAVQINASAETELDFIKNIITAVRTIKSEMNIPPSKQLAIIFNKGSAQEKMIYEKNKNLIHNLGRFLTVTWLGDDSPPESAAAFVGELEILIPMAGLINKAEESARLTREIGKLSKEVDKAQTKLQNPGFTDKAPAAVVEKEKIVLQELLINLEKLQTQLAKL